MSWPTQGEYNLALQNPKVAFRDPELRAGACHANKFGVPVPWSGQNAAVYKIVSGNRAWAVKCFTGREVSDQQVRYSSISKHLATAKLRYTVAFRFHSEGVNVKGRWYPLLQMEWVEGERLNDYVRRHLSEPGRLQQLAQRVVQMVGALQAASVAHGDLQHGNILVCNDELRLVDYDGMWVPSLAGMPPSEVGHPHYQHPDRVRGAATHFDGSLDNFSLWVIVLGLYAVSLDPSLWEQTGRGDDWLLLRDEDFQPQGSALLRELEIHRDGNVRLWALGFRRLLFLGADQVPFPDVPVTPSQPAPAPRSARPAEWIPGHRPKAGERPERTTVPGWGGSWIHDHRTVNVGRFRNPVTSERAVVASSVIFLGLFILIARSLSLPILVAIFVSLVAIDLAALLVGHRAEPDVQRLGRAKAEAAELERRLGLKQRVFAAAEREREGQRKKGADEVARLQNDQRVLRERETADSKVVMEKRDRQLVALAERRKRLDLDEAQAIDNVRRSSKLAGLEAEITKLQAALSDALQQPLKQLQEQHIMRYLQGSLVERAELKGIGPKLTERLLLAGFRTGADIDPSHGIGWRQVEGIGSAKNTSLIHWRRDLERAASRTMPQRLTQAYEAQIHGRFVPQVEQLQREKAQQRAGVDSAMAAIKVRHTEQRGQIDKERLDVQITSDWELRSVRQRFAVQQEPFAEMVRRVAAATTEQLRETDERIARIERDQADLRFKREGKRREMQALRTVAFGPYLRRVLLRAP